MPVLRPLFATLALAAVAAVPAAAQLRTVRTLSADAAKQALGAAEAEARKNNWNVAIAVVDASGELVAFLRMDGVQPASVDIARGKARTAARFRRPTKALDSVMATGRTQLLAFEGVVPVEGGVPVQVAGETVGAVGVSGVTSQQDAQVAAAGARAVAP
ncbi:MAG: heme-binding protein [Gemmatimonadales bacterium]|nr:heme-binding protein [Gemmatimonadales bacterium]